MSLVWAPGARGRSRLSGSLVGDTRYWRAGWPGDPDADYGALNAIARHKVNLSKILAGWPDMLRVAGSLITHQVRAHAVLRMLSREGRPTPLGPVDDTHRRAVNTQTTVQESRHRLARKIFHGKRGALYQPYRGRVVSALPGRTRRPGPTDR